MSIVLPYVVCHLLTAFCLLLMRREGFEPPCDPEGRRGYGPLHCRSATYARKSAWKDSNLRPRAPEARALAKLRYTLMICRMLPEGVEPIILRLKAGHPGPWTTGAFEISNFRSDIPQCSRRGSNPHLRLEGATACSG